MAGGILGRLLGGLGRGRARVGGRGGGPIEDPPRPEEPLAVIGDIHGRADLLEEMLARLAEEAPQARIVTLGDYVDRGPQSREVLERLRALEGAIRLKGNHEAMMLGFLEDPLGEGGRWLRNGGRATLASYGIGIDEAPSAAGLQGAARKLRDALGPEGLGWLQGLPLSWRSGNVFLCHAGPDPARPLMPHDEDPQALLWGHPRFLRERRHDGIWVVHGHWIVERAAAMGRRIATDTGAWRSGRLSAALLSPEGTLGFVEVRGERQAG